MTLFPTNSPLLRPLVNDKRRRTTIPTGAPRLVESPSDRASRAPIETWGALLDAIRRSASARLGLLERRADQDRIGCPWKRITGCERACRCKGAGTVTIVLLRTHYDQLAAEIVLLTRPVFVRRSA